MWHFGSAHVSRPLPSFVTSTIEPVSAIAKFTPEIPKDGRYEVRLIYVATSNRASNVLVTIRSADGEKTIAVNQKEECLVNGVPRKKAHGTAKFPGGTAPAFQPSSTLGLHRSWVMPERLGIGRQS